jgi:hypothetical protein
MKTKIGTMLAAAALLSGVVAPLASAQGVSAEVRATTSVNVGGNSTSSTAKSKSASTTASATSSSNMGRGNATSSATSTRGNVSGQLTAEAHRSEVATFVQSLLAIASRAGGIGSEVRVVAQSQNEVASTSVDAMTKIENRSGLKTFLIGSDYKSLGELRSAIATTEMNIEKLKSLRDASTDATVKADLAVQIDALEDAQADLEAFVEAHEDSFSLFGWFVKIFN